MKRAALILAAVLAACSSQQKSEISLFEVSPFTVQLGGTATLFFGATNAATLSIDKGVGDVTIKSHVDVSPTETTTYTLTATSKDGVVTTKSVTLAVVPAKASSYLVEAAASAAAGADVAVTISALGADGQVLKTFVGSATLTTDDANATLPHLATFAAAGEGKTTVTAKFHDRGNHQIVASDAQARGAASVAVTNGPAGSLVLSGVPANATAGEVVTTTLTARDAFGNAAWDFTGTVELSTNDAHASLPNAVTFTAGDKGARSVPVIFATAGSGTVTARSGALQDAHTAAVKNAPAALLELRNAPAEATSGDTVDLEVAARDRFGNLAIDYTGTVHVATADGASADVTFAPADAGVKAVSLQVSTAGAQLFTASDAAGHSGSAAVQVKHSGAAAYRLSSLPATTTAGTALSLTITAVDAKGNPVTNYAGTAHLSTGNAADQLPADGGFTGGVRTVSFALLPAGSRAVTVSEVSGTLTATTGQVSVGAAAARRLTAAGSASAVAGVSATYTVSAFDLYGNAATSWHGTLHVTSDDAGATLPAGPAADSGVASFDATLIKAGARKLVATDASDASLTATLWVKVQPAAAASYAMGAVPATATAGDAVSVSATALDAYGNVATGYAASAHFASSDASDVAPADAAFAAGVARGSLSLRKSGARTLSISEAGGTLSGSTTAIQVGPAAAASFTLSGAGSSTAGSPATFSLAAFDRYGNAATGYAGTVHVTSSDGQAVLPADASAAGGAQSIAVTLETSGAQTVTASDGPISASATVQVSAAGAASLTLSGLPASVAAGDPATAAITALDSFGNVATGFNGAVTLSTGDSRAQLPASVTASAGRASASFKLVTAGSWTLTAASGSMQAQQTIAVGPGAADHVRITGLPASAHAGDTLSAALTVKDQYENTAAFNGSLHLVLTDAAGTVSDAAATNGAATASPRFFTVGKQSLVVSDAVLTGSAELDITPSSAVSYQLAPLPAVAVAGEPLTLVATALDSYGNVDTSYAASGHVAGATGDLLPADTAFSAGRLSVGVTFTTTGSHTVTLSQVAGGITRTSSTVSVNSDNAVSLAVSGGGAATAGVAASFTVKAADRFGNQVGTYRGVVDFTSTDAQFVSPGATAFTATDAGAHAFSATFKTAASQRLDARDVASPSISGGSAWTISPAAAASCVLDRTPGGVASGTTFAFRVSIFDAFGNRGTNYAGTIGVSSGDTAAQFPQPTVKYVPQSDAGVHTFTARLYSAGLQAVTATDTTNAGVTCSDQTTVAAPNVHYAVSFAQDANYGAPATATITALNGLNTVIPDYAGAVQFSSGDVNAVLPANFTFDGTQNGVATVQVTFKTLGTQSFVATAVGNAGVTGAGSVPVHGLVYTNPSSYGTLQLVANAAASTPGVVQLDLVVAKTVRNGYGAGMNLPADSTRVLADATPVIAGAGFGTAATNLVAAAAQNNNVLYAVATMKNSGTGASTADRQINAGGTLFSVRVKLNPTAAVGAVFDGQGVNPSFRAALRDRLGNDTVGQADFVLGRLEVK